MTNGADETRHRLLEAAGEVFAEKGFRAATVREICSRADANLAAVNYHFGDKQQLYVEAVQFAHGGGRPPQLPEWPADMPPAEKLRLYIRHMLGQLLDPDRPAWQAKLMAREITQPTEACISLVESHIRAKFDLLNEILADLLPPETSLSDRHLTAFSIVGQCMHFKIGKTIIGRLVGPEESDGYDVERLTDHITQFSLTALCNQPQV